MFLINHLKFLWNGGLQPSTSDPIILRERRTLSTTVFLVLPVAIGLIVSNYYTDGERDNIYIAIATVVVFFGLYLQAYFNQQLLASQMPITAYWIVMCLAMMSVGVWANTWAWLLCLPAIASLVAGRTAGVVWAVICALTLWVFAYMHYTGYEFPFSGPIEGEAALTLAFEATLVLVMLSSATFVFRNAQLTAEKRLGDTVKQLEKEVHDRTLAENEARQSEQAKASFLAAMSHELRTPLNGVIGASQLLKGGDLPSRKKELVDVVLKSSETLLELINNVMDLSRLDSQSIELEKVPVDIDDLFRSTLSPLAFQAKEKGVKFTLVIEDDIPEYVIGDPTRLRQIVLNLVGNAVKFTNAGEVDVVLDTALDRMRLKISDTGIGINKKAQASLFEPYVQADKTTMRKFGGSGLGLTIVKQLVSAMGGKISVNSVPGRGSTFTVFLPLTSAQVPIIKSTSRAEIKLPSLLIAVADDNAVNRMVLSRLLEADGHKVVTMSNGKEVLDYLPDHDVNVIMMDLQMPVMDGVTAVRKIRAMRGRRSTIPVIAVTANVVHEDPKDLMKSGMTGFLSKPFRQEELRDALQKAMSPNPSGLA
ncbi:MAG: signal transduction histidine kinase/ActR/RegA family two-component response regulator [Kiritimatiellia bacterium]|jgi:signal transduction histidine kinase/ActR/RegA family two-component response regulator